jgi:hypothetical protein
MGPESRGNLCVSVGGMLISALSGKRGLGG